MEGDSGPGCGTKSSKSVSANCPSRSQKTCDGSLTPPKRRRSASQKKLSPATQERPGSHRRISGRALSRLQGTMGANQQGNRRTEGKAAGRAENTGSFRYGGRAVARVPVAPWGSAEYPRAALSRRASNPRGSPRAVSSEPARTGSQDQRLPSGPGALAHALGSPTDGAGDGQPNLETSLRPRPGRQCSQFRQDRRGAVPSGSCSTGWPPSLCEAAGA